MRVELRERFEREPPLVQTGVRDVQPLLVHDLVPVQEQVEIDGARAEAAPARPAELALEREQAVEQVARPQLGLHDGRCVQKPRLVDEPDRVGLAERGHRHDLDERLRGEERERPAQGRLALAEVRAETDEGADHAHDCGYAGRVGATRAALLLAALALAAPAPAGAAGPPYTLVELDRVRGPAYEPFLRLSGGELIGPELLLWRLRRETAAQVLPGLRRAGVIRATAPDRPLRLRRRPVTHVSPPDPLVPSEYWLGRIGADAVEPPGPGRPVTVVDTGVDAAHPEFAGRPSTVFLNAQRIFGLDDDHGTAVSSVVAAPANGVGLVGVYPQAALQVWDASPAGAGDLSYSSEIRAILEASRRGPGVINLSLGSEEYDRLEEEAILVAVARGSLVVASSGNEFQQGNPEEYPAGLNHVLTVSATDENDEPAFFSSSSQAVDLAAPGQNIPVAVPVAYDPDGFDLGDGTSFSAPLVSGAAAWVWTMRPDLDASQLFELMRRSAKDVWKRGFDEDTGFGLLNVPRALALRAPRPDPLEPNDDVDHVRPNGLFRKGARVLTAPGRPRGALAARLDAAEDPDDVYRVYVPPRSTIVVYVSGVEDVDLALWGPLTRSVFEQGGAVLERDLLASRKRPGKRQELLRYANRTRRGFVAYVDVFLGPRVARSEYALSVRTEPAAPR